MWKSTWHELIDKKTTFHFFPRSFLLATEDEIFSWQNSLVFLSCYFHVLDLDLVEVPQLKIQLIENAKKCKSPLRSYPQQLWWAISNDSAVNIDEKQGKQYNWLSIVWKKTPWLCSLLLKNSPRRAVYYFNEEYPRGDNFPHLFFKARNGMFFEI